MCGIIGILGKSDVAPQIVQGLKRWTGAVRQESFRLWKTS